MHFSREKAVFEVGRSKNPNFREVKQKGRKQIFGRLKSDNCRNQGVDGTEKAYLRDFKIKTSKKMNANFVSKLAFRGGASGRTRTYNPSVNSRMLCH